MRLKVTSPLATAAFLSACGSSTEDCVDVSGQGGSPAAIAAAEAGCAPGSTADFVENVGDRVFFDFDRSFVRADGMETLKRQAEWLNQFPQIAVTINGHCDKRGTVEYNLALGERRANAARDYLVKLGVPKSRLSVISYGEERPAESGQDESAWSRNRRAVFVVLNR